MLEVLTEEEIDLVSGGMGNGGGGPMKVSQLDKGSGHSSCTDGVFSGMVGGLVAGLSMANPLIFAGTFGGLTLAGAVGGGCFRNPPPKTMQE
ncbi:hypothetical protein CDL60_10990 [Roseateles noduli]|nr:hypothetical protein CDL60_10990 [Roseateles noduli]